MTTDVIDAGVYTRPTSYTGPGTVDGHCLVGGGVDDHITGYFTSTGNATQINAGFRPRSVKVVNTTDAITWAWQHGMPDADSVKIVLGGSLAGTLDTGAAITVATSGGGNYTVTFSTTLCGTSKNICFELEG